MILYLDTSSLVKLYIDEEFSAQLRQVVDDAEVIATSRVAYAEAMAAFARRMREKDLNRETFDQVKNALAEDWPRYAVIEVDEIAAGRLAAKHGLRGFDAIHLSAALSMLYRPRGLQVIFSSFDLKLNAAAQKEGFPIYAGGSWSQNST